MEQPEKRGATEVDAHSGLSFADVYDANVDEVYRFVHRRCRDHALAEDITQETFMTAIRSTDDPSSISVGWLLTVARNRLFDVIRRQARYEGKLRLVGAAEKLDVFVVFPVLRIRACPAVECALERHGYRFPCAAGRR